MKSVETETGEILVIGFGNPLRRDDGLGLQAITELTGLFADDANVTLHACQQLTPELAEHLAEASTVVFVDACVDRPPGTVECREIEPQNLSAAVHALSPESLLSLTERIYGRRPRAFVCVVGGECFEVGEGLSPALAAAMPELIDRVLEVARHA